MSIRDRHFPEMPITTGEIFCCFLNLQGIFFYSVVFILVELMVTVFYSYSYFYFFQGRYSLSEKGKRNVKISTN